MSFLFKQKPRGEAVSSLKQSLLKLETNDFKKANSEVSKNISIIKSGVMGEANSELNLSPVTRILQEIFDLEILPLLIKDMSKLEFEAKKDVVQLLNILIWRQVGTKYPTVEYISAHKEILGTLIRGYENQEISLNCGLILRECIQHLTLAECILNSTYFWSLFSYVQFQAFDIASDAFATFKDLLTKHKKMVSTFILDNYDQFFSSYKGLLESQNYVAKRQSLKLLGELILERSNFKIMIQYIGDAENLKLIMNMLRDPSRSIQFEAFHVFKVFIVNPNKTQPVLNIIRRNRTKLKEYLKSFLSDRSNDEEFRDEKLFIMKQLDTI